MLSNYLAAARRNIIRTGLYACINVIGLGIGFSVAIFIAASVRDELSYDKFIPGYEQIYRMHTLIVRPAQAPAYFDCVPPEFAAALKLDFPGIDHIARLAAQELPVRHGETEVMEKVYWADPEFFQVLPLPTVAGNLHDALTTPDGVVLTQRMAQKYFGRTDPIGELIEFDRTNALQVRAVLRDLPQTTHLDTEIIASGRNSRSLLNIMDATPRKSSDLALNVYTYLRPRSHASIDALQAGLAAFLSRHKQGLMQEYHAAGVSLSLPLVPVAAIHLHSGGVSTMRPHGSMARIYGMVVVGLLILATACINFVNLMTARAARRALEVGVRKVFGAGRRDLFVQFVGESVLYVLMGLIVALAVVTVRAPDLALSYLRDPILAGATLVAVIGVGTLAGCYPALVLSAFRPTGVLRAGAINSSGRTGSRQALVAVQFAILIGLLLATGVIYRQTVYALNSQLRLDTNQVLLVRGGCVSDTLAGEVAALSGVLAVACSSPLAFDFGRVNEWAQLANGTRTSLARVPVDFGFFELFGLKPLAGRFFLRERGTDTLGDSQAARQPAVVINETAARRLGFPQAQAAIGQSISLTERPEPVPAEIIGVVRDFSLDPVREPVAAAVYYIEPLQHRLLTVRLRGSDVPRTLNAIDRLWNAVERRAINRLFLQQHVETLYVDMRREAQRIALGAILALAVASLGLFGLAAFTAERRTKEIGIRKALGAQPLDIMRLLCWEFTKPVLWATATAWPVGYYCMSNWLDGFAHHVELEPWMFLAAAVLPFCIALLTISVHIYLVARARPIEALRYE